MKSNPSNQDLARMVQALSETVCSLTISHAQISALLLKASGIPDCPDRLALLKSLEQMPVDAEAALLAFRQIGESPASSNRGNWFQRLINCKSGSPA